MKNPASPHHQRRARHRHRCALQSGHLHAERARPGQGVPAQRIGCIRLRLSAPIFFDEYSKNRTTGSFVLVDEQTNNTVAAGMIIRAIGIGTEEEAGAAI